MTSRNPMLGWIGLDAPVEVLAAVGTPARVEADPALPSPLMAPFGEGGGHPGMRATADKVVAEADSFRRIVIGSTPVTGVWLYNFFLTLPRGRGAPVLPPMDLVNISHEGRPSATRLNRESIRALAGRLGAGPVDLRAAVAERNRVRALQRRIDALRHGAGPRLLGSVARRLLDAADQMDAGSYVALAEESLRQAQPDPGNDLVPVVYSGPGSPSLEFYVALESRGLSVVGDDADFGSRAIGPDVEEALDPVEAIARRYAAREPAPAGWTTRQRVEWLIDFVRRRGAKAVIFDLPPWSHPPAWDLPAERRALEAIGVACITAPQAPCDQAADAVAAACGSLQAGGTAHV